MFGQTQIGIDLGRYEIKIAHIEEIKSKSNNELNRLKEYESYPVDCEIYSKEYFTLLKKAIKDFSKKIKKSRLSLNFVLTVDEKHANTFFMNLPSVSEKDLNKGVKFEVEEVLADKNLSDYKSVWKIVDEYEEMNEYEILLATLDSNIIKALSKFKTINWKINRIMLQPIILERFAKENDIIVDFGYKESRVYMYKEGKLSEIQTINIGAFNVEKSIEEYFEENNIEPEESVSEIMSKLYAHSEFIESDELTNSISEKIEPQITQLIDELKRNVRSFELQNGINIDNIYYMGGLFNLNYLDMKLAAELDADIKPLNIVSKEIEDVKYDLAGLAMISPEIKDRMDFAQFIKANVDYSALLIGVLVVSLSASIALGVLNNKYESIIEEQSVSLSQQNQVISELDNKIHSAQTVIRESQDFIEFIDNVRADRNWLSDALYIIPDAIPLSMAITDLDIKHNVVTIKGLSADYSAIGFFAKKLEEYGEVEIRTIDSVIDEDGEGKETIYSVVTDTPENISDKYLMTREFEIILNHPSSLIERWIENEQ